MLSQNDVDFFREQGYLPARPLLSTEEVAKLRTQFYAMLDGKAKKEPETMRNLTGDSEQVVIQIVNAWEADDTFHDYLFTPLLTENIAQLVGDDTVRVWHDQIQYKPPFKGGPTIWHQDHPYWPIIQPADLVSAWLALEDADVDNGCMHVVPYSQKWGAYMNSGTVGSREDDWGPNYKPEFVPEGEKVEIVPCPVRAGEVMFHHCLTWHGTPPNRTDRGRPGYAVHYMPGYTRYEPTGSHLVESHVTVAPGEILKGDYFPTVRENGKPVQP